MKRIADIGAHLFLGLIFVVFGINGLLDSLGIGGFMPAPELPEVAGNYFGAMAATGYFIPLLKITEIVGGAMLLARRFAPLGLVLLAPIVVNIFFFHAFLTPGIANLVLPLLLLIATFYLGLVTYKSSFAGVLAAKPS